MEARQLPGDRSDMGEPRFVPRSVHRLVGPLSRWQLRLARNARARWSSLRELEHARPIVIDALVAAIVATVGVASLSIAPLSFGRSDGIDSWLLTFVLSFLLVGRRRYPTTIFLLIAAAAFFQWLLNLQLAADLALLIALFTVADERPRWIALGSAAILEVGAVLATIRSGEGETDARTFVFLSGLVAAALLAGANARARRALVSSLVDRAERLELERDQQAQIAAGTERTRIAREMHDIIAHSLAVIIALADGANAKLRRDPDQAGSALRDVASVGRQTLDDTRRLLGVLRATPSAASFAPQPGIAAISDLVEQARTTGLYAELRVEGNPIKLSSGKGLSAYRIVQEAITNTLKHGRGATSLFVLLKYGDQRLEIDVRDDGQVPTSIKNEALPSTGFGLEGMRERAAIYNGEVRAGPLPEGGWVVQATLPLPLERVL